MRNISLIRPYDDRYICPDNFSKIFSTPEERDEFLHEKRGQCPVCGRQLFPIGEGACWN